ncbi:CotH kinase family protein [Actinomycetes bacterium NPDC127524]
MSARILYNSTFRSLYKKIMEDILKNKFTEYQQKPLIYAEIEKIKPWIDKDPYMVEKMPVFLSESQFILDFVRNRRLYLLRELVHLS